MVTAEQTARKYAGQMAAKYESKRSKQIRWHLEDSAVQSMLAAVAQKHMQILDVPVGTGRYLHLYKQLALKCTGYDTSTAMLTLAKRKRIKAKLEVGDIYQLPLPDGAVDISICVRFMDLVPEDAMRQAMHELARVTRHHIILTIRLADEYINKVNTATHDKRKFTALHKKLGLSIEKVVPIFKQGWYVLLMEKSNGRKTLDSYE